MLNIHIADWLVIIAYLAGLIMLAWYLSRGQSDREDYYVGGRQMGRWPVAVSILATQCSTSSILGAPAFVALAEGGGMRWLQYELALPLAMIPLMLLLVPVFRQLQLVSVYAYLEKRFDLRTRYVLSTLFLFVRAFATAVTVYGIAIVVDLITGIGFFWSVVMLGLFTVIYDVMGGIKGVIYSDVIQMIILVAVLILLLFYLLADTGGWSAMLAAAPEERRQVFDFAHHGLGDGYDFAFWPMLFGGIFLYASYYGCDQSQAQRTLTARSSSESTGALLINGLLRFPLVALYCLVGLGMGAYIVAHPEFMSLLPVSGGQPEVNLIVPAYMIERLPVGLVGLGMVALFAAAMSSLDSVLNALSATTMEDFIRRNRRAPLSDHQEIMISRAVTACWGVVTLAGAFYVGDIAPTVLEAINKIGSLINGPVLAVFAMGLLMPRVNGTGAVAGLAAGFLADVLCWLLLPQVSWLWWNVIGFAVTILSGALVAGIRSSGVTPDQRDFLLWQKTEISQFHSSPAARNSAVIMALWFVALMVILLLF